MIDENTPDGPAVGSNDSASTTGTTEAKPRRTRSRRATAPAVDPGETATPDAAMSTAPAAEPADPTGEPAGAPKKRTRRSTSRAVKADDAKTEGASKDDAAKAGSESGDEGLAAAAESGAPTRPTRTRRTRATKAQSEPEQPAADQSGETAADATAEPPATSTKAAKSSRTARSARAATSSKTAAAGDVAADADAVASDQDVVASDQEDAASDQEDAADDAETAVKVGGATRLATTAVLFQAPEPKARPRRRRAEAPAGPPRPHEDEEQTDALPPDAEATPSGEGAEAEDGAGRDVQDGDAERSEESDGANRRRRRRGGRGRRGRSSGADRPDETDEGTDAEAEVAPTDEPTGEEPTAGKTTGKGKGKGRSKAKGRGEAAPDESTAGAEADTTEESDDAAEGTEDGGEASSASRRRRRRRRSRGDAGEDADRSRARGRTDEVTALKGSTRLEAKRQRRREGRDAGRRRSIITESEFLARRESVERAMVVRELDGRVQIAILEDGVLVEHYVSRSAQNSQSPMAGNVYLGRVQNVLPSMEAAFVDIGKGRNAVLYAGEVNWDAAGLEGQPRRIEQALKSGDSVLVQVTKEPVGHKGARLTSQITLAGRYLVYVPGGGMTGISRKLPDTERARLKKILKEIVPDDAGVIVRTAAEGASDDELRRDVQRLQDQWAKIQKKATTASAPALLQGEPDLAIRVVRDVFNDDFSSLEVQGADAWATVSDYVNAMAPDLADKVRRWDGDGDAFAAHRIDEQLAKGMDRKVWLPSGGSLVIDRTEAMTVIDVNTGKFTGSGGTLEETVTRNNLEAAEEIVRQLRLRDIGGIIVIDFIDMVLESNRDLVLRRLVECLGRDRTKHQVAEVTSLGLVQMTRKRVGQGLVEAFSEPCQHCNGRGFIVHTEPLEPRTPEGEGTTAPEEPKRSRRRKAASSGSPTAVPVLPEAREAVKATLATIAAAAAHAHEHRDEPHEVAEAQGTQSREAALADLADAVESVAAVEGGVSTGRESRADAEAAARAEAASAEPGEVGEEMPPGTVGEEAPTLETDGAAPDGRETAVGVGGPASEDAAGPARDDAEV